MGGPDFAALLRQQRRAAGLTQAELAGLAGIAVRTVRDVERGRTARPQRTTAVLLADALSLTGEERAGFLGAARGEAPRGVAAPRLVPRPRDPIDGRRVPASLAATPLLGRDAELARLAELIRDPGGRGPLALVGVAGVGKSALARAVVTRLADRFTGGVAGVVVEPDSVADALVDAVAAGFGVSHPVELAGRLADGWGLLLVDEVDRAPREVRAAVARLPGGLQVVLTGRAPLGLRDEQVWPVSPLEVPPAGVAAELSEVAGYPAAALFLQRLARVRPEPLAAEEVPALVGLVRRLGGLPLALELAAAHGRLLRLPEILQRYGDRVLDLGTGEQTLRDAVAGSYRLLSPAEQYALRRLAALRAWWSMDLAEQLLAAGGGPVVADPMWLLDRLVTLGLVRVRDSREYRFGLLDVVRDYATEQAEQHGELVAARRAHAVVIAQLAERTTTHLAGGDLPATVARLDEVAGEVWAALTHAANDDPHTALRLAARLPRWWRFHGWDVAGRRWLRRLLDDPRTADADLAVRAWAMVGLARLGFEHGAGAAERPAAEAALEAFRRLGDAAGEVAAGRTLGAVCRAEGRYDQARAYALAALAVATRRGWLRDAAVAQLDLAWHEVRAADLLAARRRLAAVDRLAAQSGEQRLRVRATAHLADVARLEGRYEEAVAAGRRALARLGEVGDPGHRRRVLGTVGQALVAAGRLADGERVLARLRAEGAALAEGECAAIEARLALAAGDRVVAAEWFAAAVAAWRGGADRREMLEALVGLAGCVSEPGRRREVVAELERVCREGGFVLLPRERVALDRPG